MPDDLFLAALAALPDGRGTLSEVFDGARVLNRDVALACVVQDLLDAVCRLQAAGRIRVEYDAKRRLDVVTVL